MLSAVAIQQLRGHNDCNSSTYSSPPNSPVPDGQGVGLSNPQLSGSRRRMLDLVNRLHSTGVQVDIDLPQIAVIGSQSAGKSSLIESISGITLPRAAGTCTRCPTECRLSRSTGQWKCSVYLRTTEDGKVRNEPFGDDITDRAHVEDRIRRAQRAILNPTIKKNKGSKYFLSNDEETIELTFSTDCVSLQISGPDVADLSFCDLPGLIAGVGMTGNSTDIKLVENLVTSYIKRPSTIILLTVACETDFQNQGAQELAKAHDPEGKRTIGVLTKPDRIPTGEEYSWIGLIRNEKEPLENGWFSVKQPSSQELKEGITWDDARQREDAFFNYTSPWSDLDSTLQKHLRTRNLVNTLSNILSDLIAKRLPQIHDEMEKAIENTRSAIKQLPKAPSQDSLSEVTTLLHDFVRDLARKVDGVPGADGLMQVIRPHQAIFRRSIRNTAPAFVPFERRHAGEKNLPEPKFLSSEEIDPHLEENSGVEKKDVIYVDEVLKRAKEASTRELPGNYPFSVQSSYIKEFTEMWNVPAHTLCRTVYSVLNMQLMGLVDDHLAEFGQGHLQHRVRVLLQNYLKECLDRAEKRLDWLIELEDSPFTLNTHYYFDYKEKFLNHFRSAREQDRNPTFTEAIHMYTRRPDSGEPGKSVEGIGRVLSALVDAGVSGITPEALVKMIPPDGMEPALDIMADVRAYFQVAYKRFVDNVPMAIDHELIRGVERNVLPILFAGLKINTAEGHRICKELAQENPSIASRREELGKKLARMQEASHELLQV